MDFGVIDRVGAGPTPKSIRDAGISHSLPCENSDSHPPEQPQETSVAPDPSRSSCKELRRSTLAEVFMGINIITEWGGREHSHGPL
jgi:hypothetical protein